MGGIEQQVLRLVMYWVIAVQALHLPKDVGKLYVVEPGLVLDEWHSHRA